MFSTETYIDRRKELKRRIGSGLILLLGNGEAPMNYPANFYPFRQDSSFLYYFGLDEPGLAATIDADAGGETLFGREYGVDDLIWMGPREALAEKARRVGVDRVQGLDKVEETVRAALRQGRRVHYLPQYRHDNQIKLGNLTGDLDISITARNVSVELARAIGAQRSVKSAGEIEQIEAALTITADMHSLAMRIAKPGVNEYEVAGAIEGLRAAKNGGCPFYSIVTTHGEALHGDKRDGILNDGDLLLVDAGAESPLHYASDITRTLPVSGRFTTLQKDIYTIVLAANEQAIAAMKPGVYYRDVHLHVARVIAEGMKFLGFMKGDVEAAVGEGAYSLFFPHGLGHLLGLDVHDMENIGEENVGYDADVKRSGRFGLTNLRYAKECLSGMVLTAEPGIYFIPELITQWKAQNKFGEFIDYDRVEQAIGLHGIRIEDDVLITDTGNRVLGKPIPKTVAEIESACSENR